RCEGATRIAEAIVQIFVVLDPSILVKKVIRPSDGDRVVRARARVEGQCGPDRLEVDEMNRRDDRAQHLPDSRIAESLAGPDGLESAALVQRQSPKVERDVLERGDPGGRKPRAKLVTRLRELQQRIVRESIVTVVEERAPVGNLAVRTNVDHREL